MSPLHRRTGLVSICASLLLMASAPQVSAQLLKDGQGLAGAPKAVPEKGKADKTAPVTELPEVKVEGEQDELSKGDRKRRGQIKRLPGLGTEEERKLDRLDKLNKWYDELPKDPNELSPDSQQFLENTVEGDDPKGVRAGKNDSTPRRNPADYKDPLAKP